MRFSFLASSKRRPDEFTVLVRQIPADPDESVGLHVEHFFRVNHPDTYVMSQVVYNANKLAKLVKEKEKLENSENYMQARLQKSKKRKRPTVKKGLLGLTGEKVDKLDHVRSRIDELTIEIQKERSIVLEDPKAVMPAAFISFETRWGAAVCAQTQQIKDPTKWLTEWAPEPRDVHWSNLPIPYVSLNSRMLGMQVLVFLLIFFYLIPVTFVQSLANLDNLERNLHFLRPIIEKPFVRSLLQGFLPGLALNIFLAALPSILQAMTKFEGHVSNSKIVKHSAMKYFAFMVINVFIGSVIVGSVFEQLREFIDNPTGIPSTFGSAIPQKATFFMTYIMVDGWTGVALELLRLYPLLIYHFKSVTVIRTEKDRRKATPAGRIFLHIALPKLGLYFLLGFVYAIISPLILPFILIYFAANYLIFRNQMIHVYEQQHETAGKFWPPMFGYIIIGIIIEHVTLIGVMSLKKATSSTPFLLPLPIITIIFYFYCTSRFEAAFHMYPLEEAKAKDTIEQSREPDFDVEEFLAMSYMHPVLKSSFTDAHIAHSEDEGDEELVEDSGEQALSSDNEKQKMIAARDGDGSISEESGNGIKEDRDVTADNRPLGHQEP